MEILIVCVSKIRFRNVAMLLLLLLLLLLILILTLIVANINGRSSSIWCWVTAVVCFVGVTDIPTLDGAKRNRMANRTF